ncbi:MAG: sulfotransferase [bacterium]
MPKPPAPLPTLFFCVGATKAGTSWLHSQLRDHPDCHLRSIKELHYFSMTTQTQFARAIRSARTEEAGLRDKIKTVAPDKLAYLQRRVTDLADWGQVLQAGLGAHDRYLDYLGAGGGTKRLIGDVTPAYGLLPADTLTAMARLTADVRFVYLMRDPVDRLWSHVRMNAARADRNGFAAASLQMLNDILSGKLTPEMDGILRRGDYVTILDKLQSAVPDGRFLPVFYEDLFKGDGLGRITDFLDVARIAPKAEARVHAGLPLALPAELESRTRGFLSGQYDGVERWLGALPEAWRR